MIQSLETVAQKADAIRPDQILTPNIPIAIFCQEAYNAWYLACADKEQLCAKGMVWDLVQEIPARIDYLRTLEAQWYAMPYTVSPLKREYLSVRATAVNAMDELFEGFRFYSNDDPEICRIIGVIKQGNGIQDFIIDVNSSRMFAEKYRHLLDNTDISCNKLIDTLSAAYDSLNRIYPDLDYEETVQKIFIEKRNRAYTLLFQALEELRRCARYALAHDKKRLRGYASVYFRKNTKRKKAP